MQSTERKIKRGNLKTIWNSATSKMDFYRRSSRGLFIPTNQNGSYDTGKGITKEQFNYLNNK